MIWIELDTWIVLTGAACAMACALLGNFLVLRKISLMGDAISHALLPGIVVAFLLSGSRASVPMFIGAAGAGILTAWLAEWLRGRAKVDEGASLGVVFTSLFAIGLILLQQFASQIDLDVDCVLNGDLESSIIEHTLSIGGYDVPQVLAVLVVVLVINLAVVVIFYKELKISSFDPQLATTLGINARLMHYLLMSLTAVTTVAAFEAVGPILVIAMLIVPAATAYLLTDRLPVMIALSLVIAAMSAGLGHVSAITLP
ncbi:MAG TPA: metal ABC transporter permease, partial [Tepidisphaeraceae bacterium]